MLVQKLAKEQAKVEENETKIAVMTMLKEGSVPESFPVPGAQTLLLADLTVSKRPGTSYQIEIHFAVVNHLYLLFSFMKLVET